MWAAAAAGLVEVGEGVCLMVAVTVKVLPSLFPVVLLMTSLLPLPPPPNDGPLPPNLPLSVGVVSGLDERSFSCCLAMMPAMCLEAIPTTTGERGDWEPLLGEFEDLWNGGEWEDLSSWGELHGEESWRVPVKRRGVGVSFLPFFVIILSGRDDSLVPTFFVPPPPPNWCVLWVEPEEGVALDITLLALCVVPFRVTVPFLRVTDVEVVGVVVSLVL